MTRLNVRCCCTPTRILGQVDIAFELTEECDIPTADGVLQVRRFFQVLRDERGRRTGCEFEFAVQVHDGGEAEPGREPD